MKVKTIMHKGIVSREASTPLKDLAALMRARDIGAVPITEKGELVGIVTDRDIAIRAFADGIDVSRLVARDVMTPGLECCDEEDDIGDAVQRMQKRGVRRLTVTDESGAPVGMLSLGDISHAAAPNVATALVKAVSAHH